MKTKSIAVLWMAVGSLLVLVACNHQGKRYQKASDLFEEGVRLREQHLSEDAADRFLQALDGLRRCETNDKTLSLDGKLKDNLGAMYYKHGLFADAFQMHQQAVGRFKQISDSAGLMTALRNCGRVSCSLEQFTQAKQYYDSAFQIATLLADTAMLNDLYLEIGRDYYLPTGNYPKAIDFVAQAKYNRKNEKYIFLN